MRRYSFFSSLIAIILFIGCNDPNNTIPIPKQWDIDLFLGRPFTNEQIFKRDDSSLQSTFISITPYAYIDSGLVYTIKGERNIDSLMKSNYNVDSIKKYYYKYVDLVSKKPALRWNEPKDLKFTAAVIFKNRISTKTNSISNIEDIVWMWHSGLGTGTQGNVRYTDGRNVVDGEIKNDQVATPLIIGKPYTWAVWSWDAKGEKIIASSREQLFYVIR